MARLRTSFGRFLTLGGLAAASGSIVAYHSLVKEKTEARSVAENPTQNENVKSQTQWDSDWDKRENFGLKNKIVAKNITAKQEKILEDVIAEESAKEPLKNNKRLPKATRHLYLIRHGQYNRGETDEQRKLTELGRLQAKNTGDRLKSLNKKFDKIVYSTMTRAKETAELISKSLPDVECDSCSLLREGAPCPPEPSSSSSWNPETWEFYQDGSRIEAAFRKYFHRAPPEQLDDSHELIVCHANVIRYFVCRALQFPPEGWLRMSIANCGLTTITIRPNGRVSLKSLGDAGHLPPDQITFK
eukprot:gene14406-15906_t